MRKKKEPKSDLLSYPKEEFEKLLEKMAKNWPEDAKERARFTGERLLKEYCKKISELQKQAQAFQPESQSMRLPRIEPLIPTMINPIQNADEIARLIDTALEHHSKVLLPSSPQPLPFQININVAENKQNPAAVSTSSLPQASGNATLVCETKHYSYQQLKDTYIAGQGVGYVNLRVLEALRALTAKSQSCCWCNEADTLTSNQCILPCGCAICVKCLNDVANREDNTSAQDNPSTEATEEQDSPRLPHALRTCLPHNLPIPENLLASQQKVGDQQDITAKKTLSELLHKSKFEA